MKGQSGSIKTGQIWKSEVKSKGERKTVHVFIHSSEHLQCVRHIRNAKIYMMPALGWKDKPIPSSHTKAPEPDAHPAREEARRP